MSATLAEGAGGLGFLSRGSLTRRQANRKLSKCLPGQRDAAAKWFEFLTTHLIEWGFQNHMSLPSLFRHEHRELAAVCHVDDLIIAGKVEHLEWFSNVMKEKFVISESGILPTESQQEDEAVRCLKETAFLYPARSGDHIPNLLQLYQLEKRAGKATPESAQENLEGPEDDQKMKSLKEMSSSNSGLLWAPSFTSVKTVSTFNMQFETSANLWLDRHRELRLK